MSIWETAARMFEPPAGQRRWETPGELARRLDPRTRQTPALDLIDAELKKLLDEPDGRLIISMPPQEGKSTRAGQVFPIWALTENPDLRIVTASYAQGLANRNGRVVRNHITTHSEVLGLSIADDNGAAGEWQIAGKAGGMVSVGRGAGINGRPADLLIIDDPVKDRKEADSELIRDTCWDWYTDSLSARLAPGAPVLLIMTRWHEDDLASRLIKHDAHAGWRVLNIPALADHDPDKGETDPLGRAPGEYMVSARNRSFKQWELRRKTAGSRAWASLFQGRPAPAEGDMLKRTWWRTYDQPMWVLREDGARMVPDFAPHVIISADLAFKGEKRSDYVAIQVWYTRNANAYLLDQIRARMDFVETCNALRTMAARWPQAMLKLVEDKANGPAVIASLRGTVPGIVPVEPEGGKEARVAAVSPVIESGNVYLPSPELAPWIGDFIEEAAGFPNAAHDDQVDAMTQALYRLLVAPLLTADESMFQPDVMDLADVRGWSVSPY